MIDQPGVYDLTAEQYHADPVAGGSLSSTGARKLLPPSCPALFKHWLDHGEGYKREFEFGHAAHAEVLGVGAPVAVIDAEDWRTTAAKEAAKAARAAGQTPLLLSEWEHVQGMADALRRHPVAGPLFQSGTGRAEQTLVWLDPDFGVWRRAMLDWLPNGGGRLLIGDYKTTTSVEPGHLAKAVCEHGYAQQGAWYLDGVEALRLSPHWTPVFLLAFQEKSPPYLVTVAQMDPETIQWGRVLNRKALAEYRRCTDSGHWPGYADGVISLSFPYWAQRQLENAWDRGDLNPTSQTEAAA